MSAATCAVYPAAVRELRDLVGFVESFGDSPDRGAFMRVAEGYLSAARAALAESEMVRPVVGQSTPGPWVIESNGAGLVIRGAVEAGFHGPCRADVAWLGWFPARSKVPTDRQAANALVLAAAPELVEALRDLLANRVAAERYLSILEGTDETTIEQSDAELDSPEMQRARALLARLEGNA